MVKIMTSWHLVCLTLNFIGVECFQFYTKSSHFHHYHQQPTPDQSEVDLDEERQPLIIPTNQNLTVFPGERAVLRCRVENLGTKMVIWRKKGEVHPLTIGRHPFAAEPRLNVEFNQHTGEWTLVIQDVRPSDEGLYHCQISTKNDSENTFTILLNVRTIQVHGTEYVERGGVTQLKCNATGKPDPPLNLEWFKEGARVTSNIERGMLVTKKIETRLIMSDLYIENTSLNDAGEYVCRSSDDDSATITVYVLNVSPVGRKRALITREFQKIARSPSEIYNFSVMHCEFIFKPCGGVKVRYRTNGKHRQTPRVQPSAGISSTSFCCWMICSAMSLLRRVHFIF